MTAVKLTRFDYIVEHGNRPPLTAEGAKAFPHPQAHTITCTDGFTLSVLAGDGCYCTPIPSAFNNLGEVAQDYAGPYTEVEVGVPSEKPTPWYQWVKYAQTPTKPTETVYAYVPVEMVRALIEHHGGER